MVRDRTTGTSPRLANPVLNMQSGRTMAMRWSAVTQTFETQ